MTQSVKQQGLVESPVEDVWALISDPRRYPEYAGEVIEVTGVPTKIEKGSTYRQMSRSLLGSKPTTTFKVEELDDLHEIKLRCQTSGYYSHWLLTEARGNTFVDLELGIEPVGLAGRTVDAVRGKRYFRRTAGSALDGIRRVLDRA